MLQSAFCVQLTQSGGEVANDVLSTGPVVVSHVPVLAPVAQPHQLCSALSVPEAIAEPSRPVSLSWMALLPTVLADASVLTPTWFCWTRLHVTVFPTVSPGSHRSNDPPSIATPVLESSTVLPWTTLLVVENSRMPVAVPLLGSPE